MRRWQHGVVALGLLGPLALAGCGGYARDEAPAPFPTADSSTPSADALAPTAAVESIAATASLTPAPGGTSTEGRGGDGAGEPDPVCTLKQGVDALQVAVAQRVRSAVSSFRVQLLQGGLSREVVFPVREPKSPADYGVLWSSDRYTVQLTGRGVPMRAAWVPRAPATVIIEGRGRTDGVEFRRTQTFSFKLSYANGEQCDDRPTFFHATALRMQDRVGIG